MTYKSNLAKEIGEKIAKLEHERDRAVLALEGMVNVTSGNWRERIFAINVIYDIKGKDE